MQSRIVGTTLPVLEFVLEPNETVISEAGELSWMSSSIQMQTHTQFGGGGGFLGALKTSSGRGKPVHDRIPRRGCPRRDCLCHPGPRAHPAGPGRPRNGVSDPPPWLSLRHLSGLSSGLASSNPWERGSSAETDFCCRR